MPTSKHFYGAPQQSGAVLLIALIVLTAMTILGFASLRSNEIQSSIIKNVQFLMYSRSAAKSEINGQINVINSNNDTDIDTIIQTLMDIAVNQTHIVADTLTDTDSAGLTAAQSAFGQAVTMRRTCELGTCAPAPGYSAALGGSSGTATLTVEITSQAQLGDTAAVSSQTQGFWYLMPN